MIDPANIDWEPERTTFGAPLNRVHDVVLDHAPVSSAEMAADSSEQAHSGSERAIENSQKPLTTVEKVP